jgi:hypothetical protein
VLPAVFATFEAGTDYFGTGAQQTMLNFRVRDLDAMLAQLRARGADVTEETQDMEGVGRSGWVTDVAVEAVRAQTAWPFSPSWRHRWSSAPSKARENGCGNRATNAFRSSAPDLHTRVSVPRVPQPRGR